MKETIAIKIRAFFRLLIYKELYKLNIFRIARIFSERYGLPIFGATMSPNILFFILSNLLFDDEETRADRWKQGRFAAAKELLELFNEQCLECLRACGCIDETLYPTRNKI